MGAQCVRQVIRDGDPAAGIGRQFGPQGSGSPPVAPTASGYDEEIFADVAGRWTRPAIQLDDRFPGTSPENLSAFCD